MLPAAIMAAGIIFSAARAGADGATTVIVRNDLPFARSLETIELSAAALAPVGANLSRVHVYAKGSAQELLAQTLDLDGDGRADSLVFQADIPAHATLSFDLRPGERRTYRKEDFHVYGRFVRERYDDFAWENDRIAHRMYGPALETWQKEPLTSSTVDIWLKRTRRLVINDWYLVDDYHRDTGEGADFYSAGRSRGCGGSGLWRDGKLEVSKNFRDSRVLANGPIRLVFELSYPAWDAKGVRSETKRITLDAGQNFNRFESRYDAGATAGGLLYAAGIKKDSAAKVRMERDAGWMRTWEPVKGGTGQFGCSIVLDPATITDVKDADGNTLIVAKLPAVYYAGTAWDRSGDFATMEDWDRYTEQWAARLKSPLHVDVVASLPAVSSKP